MVLERGWVYQAPVHMYAGVLACVRMYVGVRVRSVYTLLFQLRLIMSRNIFHLPQIIHSTQSYVTNVKAKLPKIN